MCKKEKLTDTKDFDAELSYNRLREKYNTLADTVISYFSEAGISDRSLRAESAVRMAEYLIRIVGGSRVPEGGYPDCCLVGQKNFNGTLQWFCTGVLVHPRIVVTAAHCYKPSASYVVALNTTSQNALAGAEVIAAKRAMPHMGYQQTGKLYDIAVIVLSQAAKTQPVPMATTEEINTALSTTLAGFGNEDRNSTVGFGIKREVTVAIESIRRSAADNMDAAEMQYGYESDLEFVAGGNGYDSCNGDSGGPAYITVNGIRKVAGLTSRATAGAQSPCGDGGIYTRIDVHQEFIRSFIQ